MKESYIKFKDERKKSYVYVNTNQINYLIVDVTNVEDDIIIKDISASHSTMYIKQLILDDDDFVYKINTNKNLLCVGKTENNIGYIVNKNKIMSISLSDTNTNEYEITFSFINADKLAILISDYKTLLSIMDAFDVDTSKKDLFKLSLNKN